jgi:lipoprotein NlpI
VAALAVGLASCANNAPKPPQPYDATLAMAAMQGRDYAEAVHLWTDVLAVPDLSQEQRARGYWGRGFCRLRTGDVDDALADADAAVALKADLPELYVLRGSLYMEKRDYPRALADFELAIRIKPDFPEAEAGRAAVHRRKGQFDLAVADFDSAIAAKPYVAELHAGRGETYVMAGKPDRALDDFDEAIRREPNNDRFYKLRGLCLYQLGRFEPAAADFRESLRLRPDQPYVALWLHLTRMQTHDADDAEFSRNAANLDLSEWPGPVFAFYRGQLKPDQLMAAAAAAKSVKDNSQDCEAEYYAAENMVTLHKIDDARRMLIAARQSCPIDLFENQLAQRALNALQ